MIEFGFSMRKSANYAMMKSVIVYFTFSKSIRNVVTDTQRTSQKKRNVYSKTENQG